MKHAPHNSHDMTEWEDTIVTIGCTPRFGSLRKCKNCEGEHAKTVAGEYMTPKLSRECLWKE